MHHQETHIIGEKDKMITSSDVAKAMSDNEFKRLLTKKVIIPYDKITFIGSNEEDFSRDTSRHIRLSSMKVNN